MKKIISYLLVMMLFVPFFVKADMGAPIVREYKAEVIKEGGVDYYDYNYNTDKLAKKGHLAKGDTIDVSYEDEIKKELYLSFYKGDSLYYIKASEVMPIEKEVTPKSKNVNKADYSVRFKVYADEVVVRKGPSASYEKVGTLSKGTTGEYDYYIEESGYIYVDVKGTKGWVDTLNKTVLFEGGDIIVATATATDKCGTIPVNTIIEDIWYTDDWSGSALVTYNNCSDFIRTFKNDYIVDVDGKPTIQSTASETKLYSTVSKKKVLATIPAGTEVERITLGGFYEYGEEDKGHDEEVLSYVSYKGQKGWAYLPHDEYIDGPEAEDQDEEDEEEAEEPVEVEEEETEPVDDEDLECEDEEDCGESVDKVNVALICAIVGVAIAGAAVITIVIVNKKKKAKVAEAAPVAPVQDPTAAPTEQVEDKKEE